VFLLAAIKGPGMARAVTTALATPIHYQVRRQMILHKCEESRRLFYVAITRAKQCLNISYSRKDKNGKDQESSQFVGEILARNTFAG
jgi:DNA helicase-2/ATP-dependent DNA helicase PcrA